jgi:hypothetical protein
MVLSAPGADVGPDDVIAIDDSVLVFVPHLSLEVSIEVALAVYEHVALSFFE